MDVKIRLLDRNLLKRYGTGVQTIDISMAKGLVNSGKAVYVGDAPEDRNKMRSGPPNNKMVFRPPEEKAVTNEVFRYPGQGDRLFPNMKRSAI